LELATLDELIEVRGPLFYDLTLQKAGPSILARGKLELTLDCTCARCLGPFEERLCLQDWTLHLPLAGPEKVKLNDDLVDLTPFIREDILLEFPQRPLCDRDCAGLADRSNAAAQKTDNAGSTQSSSAWSELNKLKL